MHWPGVVRQKQAATLQERGENRQTDFTGEDMQFLAVFLFHLADAGLHDSKVHRAAKERNMISARNKPIRALGKIAVEPALGHPAGTNIESNHLVLWLKMLLPEPLSILFSLLWQPHFKASIINPVDPNGLLEHIQMGMDLMHPAWHVFMRWQHMKRPLADMMRNRRILHDLVKEQ